MRTKVLVFKRSLNHPADFFDNTGQIGQPGENLLIFVCILLTMENNEKGNYAEIKFKNWLDKHNIPYWYINQNIETFSESLKKFFGSKRPDFLILLPNLGFILVDVKYKKIYPKFQTLVFDCEETTKHSNLQRNFGMQVWYAVSNQDCDFQTWYWTAVSKILEVGKRKKFTSSKSNQDFFSIPIKNFIQIADSDSLDRLFSNLFISNFIS